MFHLQVDSICDLPLDDSAELEQTNKMNGDEYVGTVQDEHFADTSPRYTAIIVNSKLEQAPQPTIHTFLNYFFVLMLWYLRRPSHEESTVQLCDAVTRVKSLQLKTSLRDSVLKIGLFIVTIADLITTLSTETLCAKETQKIKEEIPHFVHGWLTDTVSSCNVL